MEILRRAARAKYKPRARVMSFLTISGMWTTSVLMISELTVTDGDADTRTRDRDRERGTHAPSLSLPLSLSLSPPLSLLLR